jgi:hypothetical protein
LEAIHRVFKQLRLVIVKPFFDENDANYLVSGFGQHGLPASLGLPNLAAPQFGGP